MIFNETNIKGVFIITPELKEDDRGYYARIFCKKEYKEHIKNINIVQLNRSMSLKKGIIRGLHFQKKPKQEDKFMIRCIRGAIYDVIVDLRKGSSTYGQWIGYELSEKNLNMLFVPKGFAHGFQALKNNSIVEYSVSEYYSPRYEDGIRWNDSTLNIRWPIIKAIVSQKDAQLPLFIKKHKKFKTLIKNGGN